MENKGGHKISESEFYEALNAGAFKVFLQPKIDMVTSKLCGAEALSRWEDSDGSMRFPNDYIPQLEESGLIKSLDMYMHEEVCRLKAEWKSRGEKYAHIVVSINMSRLHLFEEGFVKRLVDIADKYEISHDELEIEITENVFVEDVNELIDSIHRIKEAGFVVSIDDFGSGFSGLNILKDLMIDVIKIDKGFLHGTGTTPRGRSIVRNIIALCLDLKVDVVTEGIETEEQIELVKSCGCHIAQGFYYSRPIPILEFEKLANKYAELILSCYEFNFENDLKSNDGSLNGEIVGEGLEFQTGIYENTNSLYFPGGDTATNIVFLPKETLVDESYTIALWIKPETMSTWSSAFYIRYEIGFISIAPMSDTGTFKFRLWNAKGMDGWYDIVGPKFELNRWTHVAVTYSARTNKMSAYINGELIGELDNVPTNRYIEEIIVGGDNFKPSFNGNIDEVVIYNEAKNSEFIKEFYNRYTSKPINNFERI